MDVITVKVEEEYEFKPLPFKDVQIKEEPEEQRVHQEEEELPPFTAVCVKSEESSESDVQSHSSPEPSLKQEIPETSQIKEEPEEQSIKQEEEQLPPFTETSPKTDNIIITNVVSLNSEDRENNSETEEQTDNSSDTDNDEDWEPLFSHSAAQIKTEADRDHSNQVQIKDTTSATVTLSHADGRRKHKCQFCQKSFLSQLNLEVHIRVHTGEKPYDCSICKKAFTQKQQLKEHTKIHTGEKFRCSVCGKAFSRLFTLKQHKRKVHALSALTVKERMSQPSISPAQTETEADGDHSRVQIKDTSSSAHNSTLFTKHKSATETTATVRDGHKAGTGAGQRKGHECNVCKKTFTTKQSMEIHTRIHTGERPYSCPDCKKMFAQKCNLDTHVKMHTGERPHRCSVCQKTFTRKNTLKLHMKMHSGEKPYSCLDCNKMFYQKCNLETHVKTHTGERPHICSVCEKTFTRKDTLKVHMKMHTG